MLDQDNRKSDDGEYTCRVENRYGAVQHTIRVQVSMSTCQHMSTHVNMSPYQHYGWCRAWRGWWPSPRW